MNVQENVDEVQIGRVLHFVIFSNNRYQCRPALVVEDWPSQGKPGYCNLVVYTDGINDSDYGYDKAGNVILNRWETSVLPNHAVRAHRSWHWPRECHNLGSAASPFVETENTLLHHTHGPDTTDEHNCLACKRQGASI